MVESRFDSDQGPNTFAPKPRFGYEAPSVLSRYRVLAIVFVMLIVAGSIYLIKAPHKPLQIQSSPEPVYIEPLSQKPASANPSR
jgi:hypothetical protein